MGHICISNINIGYRNHLQKVTVDAIKINVLILRVLYQGGLIHSFSVDFDDPRKYTVHLNLSTPFVFSFKAVSTPGQRHYIKGGFLNRHKSPYFILSSTRGILGSFDVSHNIWPIGGEMLFVLTARPKLRA